MKPWPSTRILRRQDSQRCGPALVGSGSASLRHHPYALNTAGAASGLEGSEESLQPPRNRPPSAVALA